MKETNHLTKRMSLKMLTLIVGLSYAIVLTFVLGHVLNEKEEVEDKYADLQQKDSEVLEEYSDLADKYNAKLEEEYKRGQENIE